jgi:hypothetical protein
MKPLEEIENGRQEGPLLAFASKSPAIFSLRHPTLRSIFIYQIKQESYGGRSGRMVRITISGQSAQRSRSKEGSARIKLGNRQFESANVCTHQFERLKKVKPHYSTAGWFSVPAPSGGGESFVSQTNFLIFSFFVLRL